MTIFLLLVHAICSMLLLGAITHQAVALWWAPAGPTEGWWGALRRVHPDRYAAAIAWLFAATFVLGAVLYGPFRVAVRASYLDAHAPWATGLFEIKEHAAALGLALLPGYVLAWRTPDDNGRRGITTFLTLVCWWNFLVGHVVNNVRGL